MALYNHLIEKVETANAFFILLLFEIIIDIIKIVIKRLDFSVLIAPQNDAKPIVSRPVILRNCFAPHFPTYRHNYKFGSVL